MSDEPSKLDHPADLEGIATLTGTSSHRLPAMALSDELFLLVGYLLSSAYGLFNEPSGYGPFRLVDTAGRLLEIMAAQGLSDTFLDELKIALDTERFGSSSDAQLRAVLDDLCLHFAQELKKRVE